MRRVLGQLKLAQQSEVPVLFVGEAGTGREDMARLIHDASDYGRRSFVPLDCRRLPADQLESTLERMSAAQNVDALQAGTVYFDHVEAMPRDIQRIVLKMIESNSPTTPRVMAASLRPLEPFVDSGEFLSDLQYALTSISVVVPPLRNRPEDMQHLAQFFLEELNRGAAAADRWISQRRLAAVPPLQLARQRRRTSSSVVMEARKRMCGFFDRIQPSSVSISDWRRRSVRRPDISQAFSAARSALAKRRTRTDRTGTCGSSKQQGQSR